MNENNYNAKITKGNINLQDDTFFEVEINTNKRVLFNRLCELLENFKID